MRRAADTEDQHLLAFRLETGLTQRAHEAVDIRVVALEATVSLDQGVDRADRPRRLIQFVEERHDGLLVWHGNVHAQHLGPAQSLDGGLDGVRLGRPGLVARLDTHRREDRVIHRRR
jgi:hypothetical protein